MYAQLNCRSCGEAVCDKCAPEQWHRSIPRLGYLKPEIVCRNCYKEPPVQLAHGSEFAAETTPQPPVAVEQSSPAPAVTPKVVQRREPPYGNRTVQLDAKVNKLRAMLANHGSA